MSRPTGQFLQNENKLLALLKFFEKKGKTPSTSYLVSRIGVCRRQILRYMASLEKKGLITRSVSSPVPTQTGFTQKRVIKIIDSNASRVSEVNSERPGTHDPKMRETVKWKRFLMLEKVLTEIKTEATFINPEFPPNDKGDDLVESISRLMGA